MQELKGDEDGDARTPLSKFIPPPSLYCDASGTHTAKGAHLAAAAAMSNSALQTDAQERRAPGEALAKVQNTKDAKAARNAEDLKQQLFALAEKETGGPVDPNGIMGSLLSSIAAASEHEMVPVATNPHPPSPSTCVITDPFPFCKSDQRFHAQIYDQELPEPISGMPPEMVAYMYAALKKRHPKLEAAFDFSAVNKVILEMHLIKILGWVLDNDTDYSGTALTEEQRNDIYVWTGWPRSAAAATAEPAPDA